jgi:signal transduction histidine kinase
MNPSSADDRDSASSLRLIGETLAATASLEHLARLIVSRILTATRARRVAMLARDSKGKFGPIADTASEENGGGAGSREVLALPLPGRGYVAGVVVVQDAADRPLVESFVAQAAPAVAAIGEVQCGGGDLAAVQARIAGKVLHEVNNRLGAIQIYAYLLTERLKRAEDTSGLEVATKLSSAVDRLGTSVTERANQDGGSVPTRGEVDLDALTGGCVASVAGELPGRLAHRPGGAGSVLVHEAAFTEALRLVLRHLCSAGGGALAVASRRLSAERSEITIDGAFDVQGLANELFAGESSELGRALLRDIVEGEAGTVSVVAADGGAVVRVQIGGGAG